MRSVLFSIILSALAAQAAAQPVALDRAIPSLPTAGERRAADVASWATAITVVALDVGESWRCKPPGPTRGACLKTIGIRVGLAYGAAYAVKALVHRSRPCTPDCGIDSPDSSFFSAHTAIAFSTLGGPRLAVSLPLAVTTGGLRIAAGKHYLTDVLVGAAVGSLVSRVR